MVVSHEWKSMKAQTYLTDNLVHLKIVSFSGLFDQSVTNKLVMCPSDDSHMWGQFRAQFPRPEIVY